MVNRLYIGPALGLAVVMLIGKSGSAWWILGVFTNFLWAVVNSARQFLHDRIAGTRVSTELVVSDAAFAR